MRSKQAINLQSHYSVSSRCKRTEHQMSHPAIGALWQLVQFNICNICNSKGAKRHRRPCSLFTLFSFTPLRRRQKRWRAKITISGSFLGCQRANPFSLASKSIFASMQIHFRGENELTTKEKSERLFFWLQNNQQQPVAFLGPRGPLRTPLVSVRCPVVRNKNSRNLSLFFSSFRL